LNFNGALNFTVTASDGSLAASDTFTLNVTPVNDAPIVANALADQTSAEDTAVSFVLPANSFSDVDGDTLVLSAKMADGTALPTWLTFDATTRTFSGTPPLNFNGALNVTVTASDGSLTASDTFTLTVTSTLFDPYAGWIKGTVGADILLGYLFTTNRIFGNSGNDIITGGLLDDLLDGGDGNDIITGLAGNNVLNGNAGNDLIYGGSGNDRINGGTGKDLLAGGAGNDVFVFSTINDSRVTTATRDNIVDFIRGLDKIDLSQIDANSNLAGDQLFAFVAAQGTIFNGSAGQLRWYQENVTGTINDNTIVMGDVNGDGVADFRIEIDGLLNLSAGDFIL
jgi:Ca2+-binding RTX toxin-like protein